MPDERGASSNHSLRLGIGPYEKLSLGKSAEGGRSPKQFSSVRFRVLGKTKLGKIS